MTKKDYIRAAQLLQKKHKEVIDASNFLEAAGMDSRLEAVVDKVVDIFVEFFQADNPRFDEARFRDACKSDHRLD